MENAPKFYTIGYFLKKIIEKKIATDQPKLSEISLEDNTGYTAVFFFWPKYETFWLRPAHVIKTYDRRCRVEYVSDQDSSLYGT